MVEELRAPAPDGVSLAITVRGGGPPLLMIPGLGSSRRVYDPVAGLLSADRTVVVFDPRGIGGSGAGSGPYTMAQLAVDAVAVLDAVGVERSAVWGASMGGMVAQHLALDHPGRVAALLLASTGPGGASATRADPAVTRALLGRGARTPAEAYRAATAVLYSARFVREHPELIEEQIAERARHPVRPQVFGWQFEALRGHDAGARLGQVTAPTLVLHGAQDSVMPPANGAFLASRIPGAELRLLEERGHMFFHEDPPQAAAEVDGFLRRLWA